GGADGEKTKGWVLLPPNSKPGDRRSLLVWVYGGRVLGDRTPGEFQPQSVGTLNLQLLAARGYVILIPSLPPADEPCLALVKQVTPAIDRVVELGYADPERVGVAGFSYGGHTVLSLIGQTDRFRAAVALAPAAPDLAAGHAAHGHGSPNRNGN